jgi:thioredoxin 1
MTKNGETAMKALFLNLLTALFISIQMPLWAMDEECPEEYVIEKCNDPLTLELQRTSEASDDACTMEEEPARVGPTQKYVDALITNFKTFVSSATQNVVIVATAPAWCGPCRIMEPILNELAEELSGNGAYLFVKLNLNVNDSDDALIAKWLGVFSKPGIEGIPAYIFMKDGVILDYGAGVLEKEQFKQALDKIFYPEERAECPEE